MVSVSLSEFYGELAHWDSVWKNAVIGEHMSLSSWRGRRSPAGYITTSFFKNASASRCVCVPL